MKQRTRLAGLVLVLGLCASNGCLWSKGSAEAQLKAPSAKVQVARPAPYVRIFHPDSNTIQLQIAVRKLVPPRASLPVVWLAGASHIGEPAYYRALQQHLDQQALVLFEGVKPANASADRDGPSDREGSSKKPPFDQQTVDDSLQSALAESLGLAFQLKAVDYERPHFRNSDLSIEQISRLVQGEATAAAGQGAAAPGNAEFALLLEAMDGNSFLGSLLKMGLGLIGSSTKLKAMTKLLFIETLGQIKGDLANLQGMPPGLQRLVQVLIEARNQAVVDDLKTQLKHIKAPASIAIFYGAGHMEDLQTRLQKELKFRPSDQLWLTAFSVDVRKAGLTGSELEMIRSLVKWQLEPLKPAPAAEEKP